MHKMYTITSPNSCWEMVDRAIETVLSAKYPDTSSIVNDRLRGELSNILGINLNMFDTHRFGFVAFNNTFCSNEYYVYEGSADDIDKILSKDYICNDIRGIYPDGVFAGFFKTELRDPEYRASHPYEYFKFIYKLAEFIVGIEPQFSTVIYHGAGAYSWYLNRFPLIYSLNRLIKDGIKFSSLYDIGFTFYESYDTPIWFDDYTLVYCIMANKSEFSGLSNYYSAMKFINKYMIYTGEDYYTTNTDEALNNLAKEYGFNFDENSNKIEWHSWYCVDFEHNTISYDKKAAKQAKENEETIHRTFNTLKKTDDGEDKESVDNAETKE